MNRLLVMSFAVMGLGALVSDAVAAEPIRVNLEIGRPENFDDVPGTDPAGRLSFFFEPRHDVARGGEVRVEDLDRDAAMDARVLPLVNDAHPPFADHSDDLVLAIDEVTHA